MPVIIICASIRLLRRKLQEIRCRRHKGRHNNNGHGEQLHSRGGVFYPAQDLSDASITRRHSRFSQPTPLCLELLQENSGKNMLMRVRSHEECASASALTWNLLVSAQKRELAFLPWPICSPERSSES